MGGFHGMEDLGLEGQGGGVDIVQEEGAALGLAEEAQTILEGAGEGAADMAEEFRFRRRFRNGPQMRDHEGARGQGTGLVELARQ